MTAGTLRAGAAGALASNTVYTINGGTLDLAGFSLTMSSLSGTGGQVAIGGRATLTVDQGANGSYAGSITGAGALAKQNGGQLTLSGLGQGIAGILPETVLGVALRLDPVENIGVVVSL